MNIIVDDEGRDEKRREASCSGKLVFVVPMFAVEDVHGTERPPRHHDRHVDRTGQPETFDEVMVARKRPSNPTLSPPRKGRPCGKTWSPEAVEYKASAAASG